MDSTTLFNFFSLGCLTWLLTWGLNRIYLAFADMISA